MSIKLDPRQVLAYLNEMGYCNITTQQLKEFMRDLKTLLKYHDQYQRAKNINSESEQPNSENFVECKFTNLRTAAAAYNSKMRRLQKDQVDQSKDSQNSKAKSPSKTKSPQFISTERSKQETATLVKKVEEKLEKLEHKAHLTSIKVIHGVPIDATKESVKKNQNFPAKNNTKRITGIETSKQINTQNTRLQSGISKPSTKTMHKSKPCSLITSKPTPGSVISETSYKPRRNVQITNIVCADHDAENRPLPENNAIQSAQVKSSKERPTKAFIRPRPSSSDTRLRSDRSDPVSLYHRYQSEWSKRKLPGEDNRADLRWEIRHRMLGDPRKV